MIRFLVFLHYRFSSQLCIFILAFRNRMVPYVRPTRNRLWALSQGRRGFKSVVQTGNPPTLSRPHIPNDGRSTKAQKIGQLVFPGAARVLTMLGANWYVS